MAPPVSNDNTFDNLFNTGAKVFKDVNIKDKPDPFEYKGP